MSAYQRISDMQMFKPILFVQHLQLSTFGVNEMLEIAISWLDNHTKTLVRKNMIDQVCR